MINDILLSCFELISSYHSYEGFTYEIELQTSYFITVSFKICIHLEDFRRRSPEQFKILMPLKYAYMYISIKIYSSMMHLRFSSRSNSNYAYVHDSHSDK